MTPKQAQDLLHSSDAGAVLQGAAINLLQAVILRNNASGLRLNAADNMLAMQDAAALEAAAEVLERQAHLIRAMLPYVDDLLAAACENLALVRRSKLHVADEEPRDW